MKKILLIIILLFLIIPSRSHAAIAVDAATNGGVCDSGCGTTLTYSHTTSGSNRILIVTVYTNRSAGANGDTVTGITYAGTAMTQAIKKPWTIDARRYVYLYYLFAPATGANNVVVTTSVNDVAFSSGAISYTGAAQSGTPDTGFTSENASGDRTVSVTVSTANSWLVLGMYGSADADPVSVVNGVVREGVIGGNPSMEDSNGAVGSGAQTIGLHWNVTDRHIMVALAFAPVASTTPPPEFGILTFFGWFGLQNIRDKRKTLV